MAGFSLIDYFTPLSTLKRLEGNALQRREILLFNYSQRQRIAHIGHRWAQIAVLCLAAGMAFDSSDWVWVKALCLLGTIVMLPTSLIMASTWWALTLMKRDLDK